MHTLYDHDFDYDTDETVKLFQESDLKKKTTWSKSWKMWEEDYFIHINKEWMHIARVDLFDECCTTTSAWDGLDAEQAVREYFVSLARECYGARVKRRGEYVTFALIDSMTDG